MKYELKLLIMVIIGLAASAFFGYCIGYNTAIQEHNQIEIIKK